MLNRPVSLEEQETTINIYPNAISPLAEIYTCIPSHKNKYRKLAEKYPDNVKITKEDEIGIFVTVPLKWISVKAPRNVNMTEEQKQALRERFEKARAARQK